jgi:hypothetical protein
LPIALYREDEMGESHVFYKILRDTMMEQEEEAKQTRKINNSDDTAPVPFPDSAGQSHKEDACAMISDILICKTEEAVGLAKPNSCQSLLSNSFRCLTLRDNNLFVIGDCVF